VSVDRFRAAFASDASVPLNNAGVSRCCRPAIDAIQGAAELMAGGMRDVYEEVRLHEQGRASAARLVGADPEHTAMMHTCAAGISTVALGMPMAEGDEIVTWDQEYPSNAYPWYAAARRAGARVVVVESEPDLDVDTQKLVDAIGPRTRAVAISWVQYQTGAMTELAPVAEACRRHDAWLVVDAAQALGMLPLDLERDGVDVVTGASHKWLTGPLGHGFLAFRNSALLDQVAPLEHGAMTYGSFDDLTDPSRSPRPNAKRFEPGTPLVLGAVGCGAAIEHVLACGVDELRGEALRLARRLREGALEQGARVLGTRGGDNESPVTTFVPRGDVQKVYAALDAAGVSYAPRAEGVRLSPHAYNTDDEIDQVLALVAEASSS
jgi:selenocysteine lyase/cysteine desulfurase